MLMLLPYADITCEANLEASRKETLPVQEVAVLAEALHVPLAAMLFSPLRPGEDVQPVPVLSRPNYIALENVVRAQAGGDEQELMVAVHVVRETAANRTQRAMLLDQLDYAERALAVRGHDVIGAGRDA